MSVTLHDQERRLRARKPGRADLDREKRRRRVSFGSGVTVAPASAATSEAPEPVGDQVMFANTAKDTDYMVEPLPGGTGVEVAWQLRSQSSPESNALTFRLPLGARLQMSAKVPGGAEIVQGDATLAVIPPASAHDADGSQLLVTYTVSGNTLSTHVNLNGDVDFPVLVDPDINGYYGEASSASVWSGWQSYSTCGGCFGFPTYPNLLQLGAEYTWPGELW